MPIYKGSNEVSSGNLRKGSTEIQNGYKQTDQFYVNTLAITINFVDAISGATMSTTQFSSIGTPGASFSSFTRTITTDSGRIFNGAVTVAEAGDSGNNVNASITGQGSTTATLNVSGTYPTQGVTVTLTVNGATQVQLPNLNVSVNTDSATFSTSNGSSLGTFSYSNSQSVSGGGSCSGGTSPGSGTFTTGGSSYGFPGWTAGYPAGGSFGNGCGVTCTSSISGSKSGYNSGSGSASRTGTYPSAVYSCNRTPSGNFTTQSVNHFETSSSCVDNTPATYTFTAAQSNGNCFVTTSNVNIGQSNAFCSNGIVCGTFTATCGTVSKSGTANVTGSGCDPLNQPAPDWTGGSMSIGSTTSPGNIGFFNVYWNLYATRTATTYDPIGGTLPVTMVCTGPKGTGTATRNANNGFGNISITNHFVTMNTAASAGWTTPGNFTVGDQYSCTASYTAGFASINGRRTFGGSGTQIITIQ
jgi:hypothetical protein